jgi:subtilase family serine protease
MSLQNLENMKYLYFLKQKSKKSMKYCYINKQTTSSYAITTSNPSIPPLYYSGAQLLNLYNVPTITKTSTSRQVTIAIIIAYTYPNLKKDLQTYWQNNINFGTGTNATPVPNINIKTFGTTQNFGWGQEECLDVQMVCTMNPNANIWVVEAKSAYITDLITALNFATSSSGANADIISMSWGSTEDSIYSQSQFTTIFSSYPNKCFCAASGDSNRVLWPSTSPNVIAVGGTTLVWTPDISSTLIRTEYSWNGTGCGYSKIFSSPTYQSSNIPNNLINTKRSTPDLALIANPQTSVYILHANNWCGFGGTSVSTPIFAGMLSLAVQKRLNEGKTGLTTVISTISSCPNVQTALYNSKQSNSYSNIFNDINIGSNNGTNSNGTKTLYNTGTGFDIATGLGSPNCTNMCDYLFEL